ncbi:hypothetical protein LCGC14_0941530 [marine sediment metagenome]|uniref:L-2-amino-thiazoline-4-carboxylic acid hydrolase n=1 Tax=marine sediment metagenome TaxID=412755 RepID=A0A0F9NPJ7_9ZZZZ
MAVKVLKDYYIKRKVKLMKNFSTRLEVERDILKRIFSESKVNELFAQMKSEYEKIIPEIPYLGGIKNPNTDLIVETMSRLAMFRILEKEGLKLRDIGKIFYEICDMHNKIRKETMEKTNTDPTQYPFEPAYIESMKKICETSKLRSYPDDFVIDFVEGDGKTFEWSFKIHECGIQKAFKRLDAERFVPFFCLTDFSEANILGFGFRRTQTLAFGAPLCDHTYVKNYKTPKGWPPDNLPEFNKSVLP